MENGIKQRGWLRRDRSALLISAKQAMSIGYILGYLVLLCLVFVIDLMVPQGGASGVLYVILVTSTLRSPRWELTVGAAIASTVLSLVAFGWTSGELTIGMALINRVLTILAIWVTALICLRQKESEIGRARSTSKLAAILENVVDAIITITADGKIHAFNPAAERLFGYSATEVFDKNIKLLMPSPYREEHDGYLARYLETGKQNIIGNGREVIGQRKDGTTFPLHLSVSQVVVENENKDEEILFTGIIRDLSEQKQREAEAEQRTHELHIANEKSKANERKSERASQAKSEFLANMSHELRTPLNGVIGMSELLSGTPLSPKQREFVDACRDSGESLLKLINDILDFSKIEAGKMELDFQDFDLEKLMMDTASTMIWHTSEKNLELPCYVDPASRLVLQGDSHRLRQILVNLIGNAIKFTDQGEVDVRTQTVSREHDQIVIRFSISDTGIGISDDKLNRLFQSFTQVDASTTRNYGGTGLGLVISQSLVQLMGGTIGIESKVGAGSTFWFEIPFTVVAESAAALPDINSLAGKRCLIVGDNENNQTVQKKYLSEWGIDSIIVASVDEALTAVELAKENKTPFDLVLTDFNMPQRNGLDLAHALKDHQLKTVILTDSTCIELSPNELRENNVDATLSKPIQRYKLYDIICELVTNDQGKGLVITANTENAQPATILRNASTNQILLAEDNKINQLYVTELMKQIGFTCDIANNGYEAIESIQKKKYDLVLMDCQMPELDGLQATQRIRELESERTLKGHLPIVALTANAIKGDRERCLKAGMDEYLSKPVQKDQVIHILEQLLSDDQVGLSETNRTKLKSKSDSELTASVPINAESLLERCFGSLELADSLLEELELTGQERIEAIRQSSEARNTNAMALAAHSLKGAAGILCATSLQNLSLEIEQAGHAENLEGIEALIQEISIEMKCCLNKLPQLREEMRLIKKKSEC